MTSKNSGAESGFSRRPGTAVGKSAGLCVAAALAILAFATIPAGAAVNHQFLPVPTAELGKGAPAGSGAPVTGPLGAVKALTVDSGRLWAVDTLEAGPLRGAGRVDRFDDVTGRWESPQLDEEAGVLYLSEAVGVGHAGLGEQVYAVGEKEEKETRPGIYEDVVAAFDGPSGKLQDVWTGEHTPNGSFTWLEVENSKKEKVKENVAGILGVAVDDSENAKTKGDVYVATHGGSGFPQFTGVDVFKPELGREGEEPVNPLNIAQIAGTCETPGELLPCARSPSKVVIPFTFPLGVAVSALNGDVLVTDGRILEGGFVGKVVDVFAPAGSGQYEFVRQLTGTPFGPFAYIALGDGVAVDGGNGEIYVADQGRGTPAVLDQFSGEGKFVGRLTGTPTGPGGSVVPFGGLTGVAVAATGAPTAGGDVYVGDDTKETNVGSVDVFGPDVVIPDVSTLGVSEVKVSSVGAITATLNGEVDPLETEAHGPVTACRFAWGASESLPNAAAACSEEEVKGNSPVPVSAELKGLLPDTTYYDRLQATNPNGTNPGGEPTAECEGQKSADACFTTPGPGIGAESVSEVASSSAVLNATLDPHEKPASYYFQYSTSSTSGCEASPSFCTSVPAAPGASLGSGNTAVQVSQQIEGLAPGTVYHYRVVARSELSAGEFVEFAGPDQTFTTQAPGTSLLLPDGRAWELVSPPDKHGSLLSSIGEFGLVQASVSGDAITYLGNIPTEAGAQGYPQREQIFSTRGGGGGVGSSSSGGGGWSSRDISTAHATPAGLTLDNGEEYRFFSEDLSLSVVEPSQPDRFTSLAPEESPTGSERTPYVRHDATCASEPGTCFQPLVSGCPEVVEPCSPALEAGADVPPGTKFGGKPGTFSGPVNFVDGTPDLAHVIISSAVALTSTPVSGPELYEFSAGMPRSEELRLVSVLPMHGGPAKSAEISSPTGRAARHAVSDDGSRIAWSQSSEGSTAQHLYMSHVLAGQPVQSVQLDVVQPAATGNGAPAPEFQVASSDGSRVFFTDSQQLTEGSGAQSGHPDLYECEMVEAVSGELECKLSDLTPVSGSGEGASVQGAVIGSSVDGAWVYFVANGVLAPGALPGGCVGGPTQPAGATCNLYAWHDGVTSLVAVISGEDYPDWNSENPSNLTARVSPGGRWLAFSSQQRLTGYDNEDVSSLHAGERLDQEVYLYHAPEDLATRSGTLACASCNPTGARPAGVEYSNHTGIDRLVGGHGVWRENQWLASNIPGWTAYKGDHARYQSRYLSDSGRLFFNSNDALVPQDINKNEDVYEYEPEGVGPAGARCGPGLPSGSGVFEPAHGFESEGRKGESGAGCVGLISSGVSSGESAFLDASGMGGRGSNEEEGEDVFFLTTEKLVSADKDTALDVYDARICSASEPCPAAPAETPPCNNEASCKPSPSPQPEIFGPSGSATFAGPGNLAPEPEKPATKPLTRSEKLKAALRACHRDRKKANRQSCEKAAHRTYGPVKKSKRGRRK